MKNVIRCTVILLFVFISCKNENTPPKIQQIAASSENLVPGETIHLNCTATDEDGDPLTYIWWSDGGEFTSQSNENTASWTAPESSNIYRIRVSVSDGKDVSEKIIYITVKVAPPVVTGYIYFSGTTIPIPQVTVKIADQQNTTSTDGKFAVISNTGNQQIQAEREGFDLFSGNITVNPGENQFNIEMSSVKYTSTVSGEVKNDKGVNLAGVLVTLVNPDGNDSNIKTRTDANGYYQLNLVPQGSQIIRYLAPISKNLDLLETSVFISNSDFQNSVNLVSMADIFTYEGKNYQIQKINGQWWFAENLAYLPSITASNTGSETDLCYYVYGYEGTDLIEAKATDNYSLYGVLYNWPAAKSACPPGWHLPSDDEWKQLEIYLGMSQADADIVGGRGAFLGERMKTPNAWFDNGGGNNLSRFSALPSGYHNSEGTFNYLGKYCFWWSSTPYNESKAWQRSLSYDFSLINRNFSSKENGFSVRCVKD